MAIEQKILSNISWYPANIYPYLSMVDKQDLIYLFEHANIVDTDPNREAIGGPRHSWSILQMLRTFLDAGLSPELIDADVQDVIFYRHRYANYECAADSYADLYLKYGVKMSDETLERFIYSLDLKKYASKINFPRTVVFTAIQHADYRKLGAIFKYIPKINYTNQELILMLDRIGSKIDGPEYSEIVFNIRALLKQKGLSVSDWEFMVSHKGALECLTNMESDFIKGNMPKSVQVQSIQSYANLELLKLFNDNADAELEYCIIVGPDKAHTIKYNDKYTTITRQYLEVLEIINKKSFQPSKFVGLSTKVVDALIRTKFDMLTWFRTMEMILMTNPNISRETVIRMLHHNSHIKPIIEKYWNGSLEEKPAIQPTSQVPNIEQKRSKIQRVVRNIFGSKKM